MNLDFLFQKSRKANVSFLSTAYDEYRRNVMFVTVRMHFLSIFFLRMRCLSSFCAE
jgi:hypothetical protein